MTVNHPQWGTICAVCFSRLDEDSCVEDIYGAKWGVCKGLCAAQAGIEERL